MTIAGEGQGTDVLIIGAGPVGLVLACELARHGVAARIVDADAGPTDQSRALGIQPRTLEVLGNLGGAGFIATSGRKLHGISAYAESRRIAHVDVDLNAEDTRYTFLVILPQSATERMLLAKLRDLGGDVERSTTLRTLRQDESGVTATLVETDGRETEARARWLVGCDGARSQVRKTLDIAFKGSDYEEGFLLADVRVTWDRPDDEITIVLTPEGPVVGFPLPEPGRWRLVKAAEDDVLPADAASDRIVVRFLDLLRAHGWPAAEVSEPSWTSAFRIHRRVAERFRAGRCFLAGDAAHIHSPAGGQGMNTGIQDASNLAWKLALVTRGDSPDSLLDSYSTERKTVAAGVIRGTHLATRMVTLRDPIPRTIRDHLVPMIAGLPFVRRKLMLGISELAVHYRRGPLASEDRAVPPWSSASLAFNHGPRPGDRVPDVPLDDTGDGRGPRRLHDILRGTRPVLLLFEGMVDRFDDGFGLVFDPTLGRPDDPIEFIRVVRDDRPSDPPHSVPTVRDASGALHARFGAHAACLYLIRPDGYVGYRALPPDPAKLARYLRRIFLDKRAMTPP